MKAQACQGNKVNPPHRSKLGTGAIAVLINFKFDPDLLHANVIGHGEYGEAI